MKLIGMRKMNKGIFVTKQPPILKFANQQEARKRIWGIALISFILLIVCTAFNIQLGLKEIRKEKI